MENNNEVAIFQAVNGALELRADVNKETIWANTKQIATIFDIDRSVVSRHIKNIFKDTELNEKVVCANFAHATQHGAILGKTQTSKIKYYNLDIVLAVGYRTNSVRAILFRKWATETLKQHILEGFTINSAVLQKNKAQFLQNLEDLKILVANNTQLETKAIFNLIQNFSNTFFALDSYDRNEFPKQGTQMEIESSAFDLKRDLQELKADLIKKGEASELFAQEKRVGNLDGIFGTVFNRFLEKMPTQRLKLKPRICCISLSKIIRLTTAISAVVLLVLCGYCTKQSISLSIKSRQKHLLRSQF